MAPVWWKFISCSHKVQIGSSGLAGGPPRSSAWHPVSLSFWPHHLLPLAPHVPGEAHTGLAPETPVHQAWKQPLASPHSVGRSPVTWPRGLPREAGVGRVAVHPPLPLLLYYFACDIFTGHRVRQGLLFREAVLLCSIFRPGMVARRHLHVTSKYVGVAPRHCLEKRSEPSLTLECQD